MTMHVKAVTPKRKKMTVYAKKGFLYLDFRLDGKRKQKALRLKDTKANRKVVEKEIIPQLQTKIILGEYSKKEKVAKKFKYYSDIFLDHKEKTIKTFMNKLPMYLRVIEFFENEDVNKITRLKIKQYLTSLGNITNETKRDYLAVIKQILDFALDDEEISHNVAVGIDLPKDKILKEIKYLEKDEEATLIADKDDIELSVYISIGTHSGLRPEEILGLKKSDIKNGFAKIQRVKTKGKIDNIMKTDSSRRTIPFNIDISRLEHKSDYLFPDIKDVSALRYRWEKLLIKHNIEHRGISICRHTFATHLLKDNVVSINELSGLLGHAKVSTTLSFYTSVIDSFDEKLSNKLQGFCYPTVT